MKTLRASIIAICFFLQGCSAVKGFVIGNLDWFIMKELDQQFDLTDAQYDVNEKRIRKHIAWFQKNQMDLVIQEFQAFRNRKKPLNKQEMQALFADKTMKIWTETARHLSLDAAKLFKSLSPEQLAHFEAQLKERSEKRNKIASLKGDDFQEAMLERQEERIERMEEWFGELTEAQTKMVIQLTHSTSEEVKNESKMRLQLNREFMEQVKARLNQPDEKLAQFLTDWAIKPGVDPTRYDAYRKKRLDKRIELWAKMETMITPEQRKFQTKKIDTIIWDLMAVKSAVY